MAYVVGRITVMSRDQVAMAMCLMSDGMPARSVADCLNIPLSTFHFSMHRARRYGFAAWTEKHIEE